jgi:hypothetical protein
MSLKQNMNTNVQTFPTRNGSGCFVPNHHPVRVGAFSS